MKKVAIITWMDAFSEDARSDIADLHHKPIETRSVGYVLKSDEIGITIAMDDYPEHPTECHTISFIPIGMVRDVRYLT
jgi:hypothetical protein